MSSEEQPITRQTRALHEAIQNGTLDDVRVLLEPGVDLNAGGRFGSTALMVAIDVQDVEKLKLLLERGADPEVTDDFNKTALGHAVSQDFLPAVRLLLEAGVDRGYEPKYPRKPISYRIPVERMQMPEELKAVMSEPEWTEMMEASAKALEESSDELPVDPLISEVQSLETLHLFLEAGDRLGDAPDALKAKLLGLPEKAEFTTGKEEFLRDPTRRFGKYNAEQIHSPFWDDMVRTRSNSYLAQQHYLGESLFGARGPIWCNQRFGASLTPLPDGRYIQIGGEHEDYYDPDFCIYNDVIVFEGNGEFQIFGYPQDVFPPTDFHSATLVGEYIYVIGSLGYVEQRSFGTTPVYRLNISSLVMEEMTTDGASPGWIHKHLAKYLPDRNAIQVTGGELLVDDSASTPNRGRSYLDLATLTWYS